MIGEGTEEKSWKDTITVHGYAASLSMCTKKRVKEVAFIAAVLSLLLRTQHHLHTFMLPSCMFYPLTITTSSHPLFISVCLDIFVFRCLSISMLVYVCLYVRFNLCPSQCLFFCVCLSLHKCPLSCLPDSMSFLYLSLCKSVFLHFLYLWSTSVFISVAACLNLPVSVRLSVCPFVCLSSCLYVFVSMPVCMFICLSSCLYSFVSLPSSVCLVVCQSFRPSISSASYLRLSVCLHVVLYVSVCECLCLYVSVCLCVYANLMACNARAAPNWAYIFQERQWYRPQATQQKGLKVRRGGATVEAD